jgi:hypothetical protein
MGVECVCKDERFYYAVSADVEAAGASTPTGWSPNVTPLQLAMLFKFELYGRCCMYGEAYVTSTAWKATKTRDNQWVAFQHHVNECETYARVYWTKKIRMHKSTECGSVQQADI